MSNELILTSKSILREIIKDEFDKFHQSIVNKEDYLITTDQAAKMLGRSSKTINRWAKLGIIKPDDYRGRNRYYLVSTVKSHKKHTNTCESII